MPQSYIEYNSGLTGTTFSVPFKYISVDDVHALGFDGEKYVPLTISSRSLSESTITLAVAPNSLYTKLRLYRATSTTQLVDFQNGSRLSESDLDTAYQQGLFVAQEVSEDASTTQFSAVRDGALQTGTSLSNFASEDFTGDGTSAVFAITGFNPATIVTEAYRVSIDGVMQSPVDAYSITLTPAEITFASAPPSGSKIVVVTAASAASAVSVDDVTIGLTGTNKAEIKDGGVDNDKLAGGITQEKLAGGITQEKLAGGIATSKLAEVIDDNTFTTGVSATSLASSESIKAYVDESAMKYSGATGTGLQVSGTSTYRDLDLSSVVGANRALVIMELEGTSGSGADIFFRTKGSTVRPVGTGSIPGWGASGGHVSGSNDGFTCVVTTNENGVLEYTGGNATGISYNIQAYQKLR